MTTETLQTTAALFVGALGLFIIWNGITGDDHVLPKWVLVLSGVITLILPAAYLVLCLLAWASR